MPGRKNSIMVRMSMKTHERLNGLKSLFMSQWYKGQMQALDFDIERGLTIDGVIRVLLDRDEQHRERAAAQRGKRPGRKAAGPES